MAEIKVRPNAAGGMEVNLGNGTIKDFGIEDGIEVLDVLVAQAKGHIEVNFSAYGRRLGRELTNKVLELAGLSSLAAANALAAGKVNL